MNVQQLTLLMLLMTVSSGYARASVLISASEVRATVSLGLAEDASTAQPREDACREWPRSVPDGAPGGRASLHLPPAGGSMDGYDYQNTSRVAGGAALQVAGLVISATGLVCWLVRETRLVLDDLAALDLFRPPETLYPV